MAHDVSGYVKLPEGVVITTFMNHLAKWMMLALSERMTKDMTCDHRDHQNH